jgi:hypothetical protein
MRHRHESSMEEQAGLRLCQMYHTGLAWRSEVQKTVQASPIDHLLRLEPALEPRKCTQAWVAVRESFRWLQKREEGNSPLPPVNSGESLNGVSGLSVSEISCKVVNLVKQRSAGGPPVQPQPLSST